MEETTSLKHGYNLTKNDNNNITPKESLFINEKSYDTEH
mgnify:CR=1 FL=1